MDSDMGQIWDADSRLDRAERHRRDEQWLASAWSSQDARVVAVPGPGEISATEDGRDLQLFPTEGTWSQQRHIFLGLVDQTPLFAVGTAPADATTESLRRLNQQLEPTWADVATTAVAITQWHRMDPHCPRCGASTEVQAAGFARWCPLCAQQLFPRTDSAIIVAILDEEDRLLLGHQASWPEGRASLLAGFVESGESLEHAVYREMAEESGLRLSDVAYFGSQPWPFPRSLMVGFFARAADPGITVDGDEITEAGWFDREQVHQALEQTPGEAGWGSAVTLPGTGAQLSLPGPGTIAHRMIQAWLSGNGPDLKHGSPGA